jgi:PKD domain-containing protein
MKVQQKEQPRRGQLPPRLWRIGGAVLGLVLALSVASAGYAGITDINPNASDNSNANASSGGRVNGLANASGNNQVFYAASEYGGLYKTTDGGNNWAHLDGHQPVMTWDVEVDPSNNNKVYATSWYDGRVNSLAGIEVSSDAGATWTRPASVTPPGGYNCSNARKTEPSSFGISIRPDAASNVFVGTNCGVARSTDSGATWTYIDPTPGTSASDVWDVVAQSGGTIDACGDDGHLRSTDNGTTWTADSGAGIPLGRCSIAVSPDESYVLFVVASDNNLYESDDAGANWTSHGSNGAQGRVPFVETNQRSDSGGNNRFSLWYMDTQLFRGDCTTPNPPGQGGAARCGAASGYSNQQSGGHWDGGAIVFDSAVSVDSCPMIMSSDGGVHRRTAGCESPTWTRSNVGVHATFVWAFDGADQAGNTNEDLLYGLQDDGTFATTNGGAGSPTWTNPNCCDTFDVLADPAFELGSTCCFNGGRFNRLELAGSGYAGNSEINTYPAGNLPGFTWGHRLAQFGTDDVAMISTSGIFVTQNINASPIVWSQLAAMPGGSGTPCGIQASVSGGTPTFLVRTGQCTGRGNDGVFTYQGITNSGTWTRIDNTDGLSGGLGIVAIDPSNPNNIYASNLNAGGPQMVFSTDGGTNWTNDPELDTLMTANGVFRYSNTRGASTNNGGAGTSFQGYVQPSLLAYDPSNGSIIVAGGQDSGIFLSVDGGTNWSLVTDPNAASKPHLPRPRDAYFDHEPVTQLSVYVGTQGRGIWRLAFQLPTADAGGPYTTDEGTDVTLDASGSTDPDGGPLTYAWDLDNDGQYDDATGVSPTFSTVGQDGVFTVSVKATDPDGGYDTDSTTVTVNNVAPRFDSLSSDSPKPENTAIRVDGVIKDAGWLDPLTATVDWGDGTAVENVTGTIEHIRPDASLTFNISHTYGDDGTFTAHFCAFDDDTSTCQDIDLTTTNVDPTATIDESGATIINGIPTVIGHAGQPVTFSGQITDPGSDDETGTWHWNDGTPDTVTRYLNDPNFDPDPDPSPTINPRDITDTHDHTFGDACLYTVTFQSADDDNGVSPVDTIQVIIVGNADETITSEHWRHEFNFRDQSDFTDAELNCYLLITGYVSNVFNETRDASTIPLAGGVLALKAPPLIEEKRHLDAEILAAWLNFANGSIDWNQLIDTDKNGTGDTPFSTVMATAEAVRNSPFATKQQYIVQRDLLRRVNSGAA